MKLSAVEGQLKVAQEKLKHSQVSFDGLLQQEKEQWVAEVLTLKEQHQKEVNSLKEELVAITSQLKKPGPPKTQVSLPSPENSRKKVSSRGGRRPTELPSNLAVHLSLPTENRLSRSADNLADWNSDDDEGTRVGLNKMTITQMVEESLKKPESIAAIRRELKEAKLTPRIQRRFGPDTKPPPLKLIESPTGNDQTPSFPLTENVHAYQSNAI